MAYDLSMPDLATSIGLVTEVLTWAALVPGVLLLLVAAVLRLAGIRWHSADGVAFDDGRRRGVRWFDTRHGFLEGVFPAGTSADVAAGSDVLVSTTLAGPTGGRCPNRSRRAGLCCCWARSLPRLASCPPWSGCSPWCLPVRRLGGGADAVLAVADARVASRGMAIAGAHAGADIRRRLLALLLDYLVILAWMAVLALFVPALAGYLRGLSGHARRAGAAGQPGPVLLPAHIRGRRIPLPDGSRPTSRHLGQAPDGLGGEHRPRMERHRLRSKF